MNSGHRVWWQVPLSAEPSHRPKLQDLIYLMPLSFFNAFCPQISLIHCIVLPPSMRGLGDPSIICQFYKSIFPTIDRTPSAITLYIYISKNVVLTHTKLMDPRDKQRAFHQEQNTHHPPASAGHSPGKLRAQHKARVNNARRLRSCKLSFPTAVI